MDDFRQIKFDVQDNGEIELIDDLTVDYMSSDPNYDGVTPVWLWADPVIFDDKQKETFFRIATRRTAAFFNGSN